MPTTATLKDHDAAVIAALAGTGRPVGDARIPDDDTVPYVVVYPAPGTGYSGPVADPDADTEISYQLTNVGATREQARWMADKSAEVLAAASLAIEGRSVSALRPEPGDGSVNRDDDLQPPLFYAISRWRLTTTPTT